MKYLARIAGLIAIIVALYILVGEQLVGTSSRSFVNAELKTLRAPVAGQLALRALPMGARVQSNETVGSIATNRQTPSTISGLYSALALESAELAALTQRAGDSSEIDSFDLQYEILRRQERIDALEEERRRLESKRAQALSTVLRTPSSGIVWSTPANTGEFVAAGDPVAHFVDCSTAFVHASVDQRLYNRLSLGEVAQFRLNNGPTLEATIALLGGMGTRENTETLAIAPPQEMDEAFTVLLSAPGLAQECALGRTGRVIFSEGPLSFLADWWDALGG
ncbi:HlyD family efflux transporter periplasmic adaptor subunit [Pelagibacterium xiamenense]|uniref:HlyD family efflux transporter periplasmic adaptor subunit n=1 Tax=Pelagibacterium xiamenense TaxID=2901140 RepID=UPI001E5E8DAD|nr:HlyD family secretion protein [Pelagibacterium xiamenense]MCD7060125.1 HlyD family secretion protein [Pelagibacterium xiamenense]